ncbi:MAG: HAD family phosphatase [Rikenellaceae bacterium]|jgi:HAD superfamily hydrolase (TIGR01509 family)|nr:HAD family phosphatase [Rikenellaceae bacterium]
MIKGIIFDMDGVLVDNRDIHIEAFRIFSRRHGVTLNEDGFMETFGRGNDEIIPSIWPRELYENKDMNALSQEKEVIYRDLFRDRIEPTKGLVAFIDEVKRRGYKLAVGSSGPEANVRFVLEKCGIADKFDAVVHSGLVTRCKPAPDIYLLASELLGFKPEECLVIEDAPPGIESAHLAGCHVAVLATTFPRSRFADEKYDLISDNFIDFDTDGIAKI